MRQIPLVGPLANGRFTIIDEDDFALVSGHRWEIWQKQPEGQRVNGPYARAHLWRGGRRLHIFMHKFLTGWPRTDHVNHDGLDNQRHNLRPATNAQNNHNQRPQSGTSSRFKGVTWHKQIGKWQASIKVGGKGRYLGVFVSEEDAALAYNAAALEAYGEYAYLNEVAA